EVVIIALVTTQVDRSTKSLLAYVLNQRRSAHNVITRTAMYKAEPLLLPKDDMLSISGSNSYRATDRYRVELAPLDKAADGRGGIMKQYCYLTDGHQAMIRHWGTMQVV